MFLPVVFAALFSIAYGHVCLLSPPQRGSLEGLNTAGADNCGLTTGPCGGKEARHDAVTFHREENMTVVFMKNLDHFNSTSPGKFEIALGENNDTLTRPLHSVMDTSDPSLHVYEVSVPVPRLQPPPRPGTHYFLQITYTPNHAGAPKEFFQCADVFFEERGPPHF